MFITNLIKYFSKKNDWEYLLNSYPKKKKVLDQKLSELGLSATNLNFATQQPIIDIHVNYQYDNLKKRLEGVKQLLPYINRSVYVNPFLHVIDVVGAVTVTYIIEIRRETNKYGLTMNIEDTYLEIAESASIDKIFTKVIQEIKKPSLETVSFRGF